MTDTAPEQQLISIGQLLADPYRELRHRREDVSNAILWHAVMDEHHAGEPCQRCDQLIEFVDQLDREREGLRALDRLVERYGISA